MLEYTPYVFVVWVMAWLLAIRDARAVVLHSSQVPAAKRFGPLPWLLLLRVLVEEEFPAP